MRERQRQTDGQKEKQTDPCIPEPASPSHRAVSESKIEEEERERASERETETDRQTDRHAYLSQLLHLVGADVRAVSESKIEEEERERERE